MSDLTKLNLPIQTLWRLDAYLGTIDMKAPITEEVANNINLILMGFEANEVWPKKMVKCALCPKEIERYSDRKDATCFDCKTKRNRSRWKPKGVKAKTDH